MRGGTLCIIYLCKSLELTYVFTVTVAAEYQLIKVLFDKLLQEDNYFGFLILALPICGIMMLYHLFYNNLFMNIRFKIKMNCFNFGRIFCVDWPNLVCCNSKLKETC